VPAYNDVSPAFRRLSLPTQTAYARLFDLLLTSQVGDIASGASLVSKTIRGRRYWYAQRLEGGKKRQTYIGPETPEVADLLDRWRRARRQGASRAELVAMARAGGAYLVGAAEARVLERLSGVFRIGAVLVGSHAFAVLGNTLGVRWQDAMVRTEDVDIAHDHRIAVALSRDAVPVNLRDALEDPIPRLSVLNPTAPATSFQIRGTEIQVDLLTPLLGRARQGPIHISALGVAATPLRFLDYLIEDTQPAAVLGGQGVLVNVPRPGRFAFHKLIVASRRGAGAMGVKAAKDRAQASALLSLLMSDLPGEVTLAWKALAGRGKAWVDAVRRSVARLDRDLAADLEQRAVGLGRG